MDMKKSSMFRLWVQTKWYEHVEELEAFRLPVNYNSKDYFRKYKYWLKREFVYQQQDNSKNEQ
jgi:hypothetical protein